MKIAIIKGDITTQHVDAIVNAAKPSLLGGGGVDGSIHRAAGPRLLEACREIGPWSGQDNSKVRCETGGARVTEAFDLSARIIIHTVGPVYAEHTLEEARELLGRAHWSSLEAAEDFECLTVAFPAISTGVYGYPVTEAAEIAISVARRGLPCADATGNPQPRDPEDNWEPWNVDEVRFVLFTDEAFQAYKEALAIQDPDSDFNHYRRTRLA